MPWYRVPTNFGQPCDDAVLRSLLAGRDPVTLDSAVHVNFGSRGNRNAPRPCSVCGWISEYLCDWKLEHGRDCDRPLCFRCTTKPSPDKDICPQHVGPLKAWFAARTNSTDGVGP